MSKMKERYLTKYIAEENIVSSRDAGVAIGLIIIIAVLVYLYIKRTSAPMVKQWKLSYNEEGLVTGIQMVEVPKV